LASNEFTYDLTPSTSARASSSGLILARDVGAPANPTYTVTALYGSGGATGVNGEAKIFVISAGGVVQHALTDSGSVGIGTSETVIGTVSTTFVPGDNVVIAAHQYDNTLSSQRNVLTSNSRVVQGGTPRASNEFEIRLGDSATTADANIGEGLLWRHAGAPANPSYDSRALASATGVNGETKIAVIHIRDATDIERPSYPSLATTYDVNGDLWVAYAREVDSTTQAIYARFLDYPTNGFVAAETVDSLSATQFTRPTIGIDRDGNVYALYVALSGPQLYNKSRIGGSWGVRTAVDTSSDYPSLMVRAPNDSSYGSGSGGVYWKPTTSQTYFYAIPEFETVVAPILGTLGIVFALGRRHRLRGRTQGQQRGSR